MLFALHEKRDCLTTRVRVFTIVMQRLFAGIVCILHLDSYIYIKTVRYIYNKNRIRIGFINAVFEYKSEEFQGKNAGGLLFCIVV